MSWLKKFMPGGISTTAKRKGVVPEGLWIKCDRCSSVLYRADLERNQEVCPKCGHHRRINARTRIDRFLDPESRLELGEKLEPVDFLKFKDSQRYRDRLNQEQRKTSERDALVCVQGQLCGLPVVVAAFEFSFMGGSMGSVVGERFCRAIDCCLQQRAALVCFTASGGARMQEALVSLLQMAKTSAALTRLAEAKIPFISVLTDPTMGGVSASLAMLGDVILAEPDALIGFAGPRVIEQTVRETLPEGFQRSEFLLAHGSIDAIVDRREMRDRIANLLEMLTQKSVVEGAA